MGMALRPGQDKLTKAVNDFVARNTANGELNKLYQNWLGADLPQAAVSLPERSGAIDERRVTDPPGTPPIIRVEGVNKWYDSFQVLTDINLSVRPG